MGLNRKMWCECATELRRYCVMERQLGELNIDISESMAGHLADKMIMALCDGNYDFDYDMGASMSWIVVWCTSPENQKDFKRETYSETQKIHLEDADDLYEFIEEMKAADWSNECAKGWCC